MISYKFLVINNMDNRKVISHLLNRHIFNILVLNIFLLTICFEIVNAQSNNSGKIFPCKLLTPEQVNTVLPDNDSGYVAHSGGSLIRGVDSYQCTYSNDKWEMFSVYVTVAPSKKLFSKIKPDVSTLKLIYKYFRKIKVGDQGWVYGNSEGMEVKFLKGYKVINLKLLSSNANKKVDELINIASIIAKKF